MTMSKLALLFCMLSVSSFAAISPPWVMLANKNCNGETACIETFRKNEMESLAQFQKNNPRMKSDDFLAYECFKQKVNTQEICVKMYKQNHLLKPKTNKN